MHRTHPTIDMIYRDIVNEIPTLSKTTVYNTMKLFTEKGLVMELTIDSEESHFDIDKHPHSHFECIKCKRIYDIEDICEKFDTETIDGHRVLQQHVYLKGICKHCQN